jgi:hypothetical protein
MKIYNYSSFNYILITVFWKEENEILFRIPNWMNISMYIISWVYSIPNFIVMIGYVCYDTRDKAYAPHHDVVWGSGSKVRRILKLIRNWRVLITWDIMPCRPLQVNQRLGGTCRLHRRDWFFNPEDCGDMFLRNTWYYVPKDRTLHNYRCVSLKSYWVQTALLLEKGSFAPIG